MSYCIFCYKPEGKSKDLKVCSTCTSKFVSCGREKLDKLALKHTLTREQSKFLGVRYSPVAQVGEHSCNKR